MLVPAAPSRRPCSAARSVCRAHCRVTCRCRHPFSSTFRGFHPPTGAVLDSRACQFVTTEIHQRLKALFHPQKPEISCRRISNVRSMRRLDMATASASRSTWSRRSRFPPSSRFHRSWPLIWVICIFRLRRSVSTRPRVSRRSVSSISIRSAVSAAPMCLASPVRQPA